MRVGLIGGGTIARLIIDHVRRGELGRMRVVAIAGRGERSTARNLARQRRVPYVIGVKALLAKKPDVVVEAASHDAVREYGEAVLRKGKAFIALSGGVLADDTLRARLERAAAKGKTVLYVPSGGIGGLDALKAACVAGANEVTIAVTKPPQAWKGIAYVEQLGVNLESLREPTTLYDGPARKGVPLFPANVNIAAVLSMAGIGFDRTRLKVVAVPGLTHNTHFIDIRGPTGNISVKLENVPAPENPKTAWLACYSVLAALKAFDSRVRYGT